MSSTTSYDVMIAGGGVAGTRVGIFPSRAGLETLIIDQNESMLRKNAHLENFPGIPLGIPPKLFIELLYDHAEQAGCTFLEGEVADLDHHPESRLVIKTT